MSLSVVLKTSFKLGNGEIVPAHKSFMGEIEELPTWLVAEIQSNSSAISVKEIAPTFKFQEISSDEVPKIIKRRGKNYVAPE